MAFEFLLSSLVSLGLGALGALLGAILLWKFYALPKINRWILQEGSSKLRAWMQEVVEHPDGEQGKAIGQLTGVAFSYALQGLQELAMTKEGRERIAPLMEMLQQHIEQSIFATWGHILQKLRETGGSMPGVAGAGIPDEFLGLGDALIPKALKAQGVDLPGLMKLAGMLQGFSKGNGNGGSWGSSGGNSDIYRIR